MKKNKFDNETIEYFIFRHFNIHNFEVLEYISFYISSFQILAPTPVGVQISEDVPIPGMVLVAEGIRVPEDVRVAESVRVPENIRVPEIYEYSTEKN